MSKARKKLVAATAKDYAVKTISLTPLPRDRRSNRALSPQEMRRPLLFKPLKVKHVTEQRSMGGTVRSWRAVKFMKTSQCNEVSAQSVTSEEPENDVCVRKD
jgi:hypothetical protein